MNRLERIKGCLLGGAVGDALGAPVEFLEWPAIEAKFGPHGIVDFSPAYGITGAITDDTQMMLFTAGGLMRAYVRGSSGHTCHVPSVIHHALLRWLMTQDQQPAVSVSTDGWVFKEALAIGLWCALSADSLEDGVIKTVNHSGDSDSTGLIAGHLLGIQYGSAAIPARRLKQVALREVIEQIAEDFERVPWEWNGGEFDPQIDGAYPGR
jgi:ADP-ribosylglycohydrolase